MMQIFLTDLDNTLIYSYKRDIGNDKRCVEIYQGREISYMTNYSYNTLQSLNEKILIVPVTTRTVEQYGRISLGISPGYALTCNGGVLLKEGKRVKEWYEESLRMIADCVQESKKAIQLLEEDENRTMEVRWLEELFVFTKSNRPEHTMEKLKQELDMTKVDVMNTGIKVYVVPKVLSKGDAILRFREYLKKNFKSEMKENESQDNSIYDNTAIENIRMQMMAAGDSDFDISMLGEADVAFAPKMLAARCKKALGFKTEVIVPSGSEILSDGVFSDGLLSCIERMIHI